VSATVPFFAVCTTADTRLIARVRRWVRQRRDALSLLSDILDLLRMEHATGEVRFRLNQGSLTDVEFREEATLDELSS
jgi:peptide subunit release factor RF-3